MCIQVADSIFWRERFNNLWNQEKVQFIFVFWHVYQKILMEDYLDLFTKRQPVNADSVDSTRLSRFL